jgi:soluble lytic murein transglycosylase
MLSSHDVNIMFRLPVGIDFEVRQNGVSPGSDVYPETNAVRNDGANEGSLSAQPLRRPTQTLAVSPNPEGLAYPPLDRTCGRVDKTAGCGHNKYMLSLRHAPWILLAVLFGLGALLAGCVDAPPTPTPAQPTATSTVAQVVQVPANTATWTPSATLTPSPTAMPTRTPSPTVTPSPTRTPTRTPTPTSTPTPSPTLVPSVQLDAALRHQSYGEYDQAIAAYQALLGERPPADLAREARYHLAESYLLNRDYLTAADAWDAFAEDYPGDGRLAQASLMAGRAYQAAEDCPQAISRYQDYLARETILADRAYEWLGDCHASLAPGAAEPDARWQEAIAAYRQALAATGNQSAQANLREKIANAYLALGDQVAAVAEYDAILKIARISTYRAQVEYLAGQAWAAADQAEKAQARYLRAVQADAKAEYAYLSLVELVNAGVEVDEFQRGLVDYYAGANHPDAYAAAIRAFARYLGAKPAARAEEALYYQALAQRAADDPAAALDTLESLISGYPQGKWLVRAWLEKGATFAWMGDNDQAVKAYQDLAAFFPADDLAPQALWRAARLRDGEGNRAAAARLYEEIQASFPAFEDAGQALWWAGLDRYLSGAPEEAVADWQALVTKYPQSEYRVKSLYWLGKLGAKPVPANERDYWDQVVAANPHNYYALRVQQIRAGVSLTTTRLNTAAVEPPPWDAGEAQAEMLDWLEGWTQVPTGTKLIPLPATLARRADLRRAMALLAVGLRREALTAFDSARAAAWDEPLPLAQLALFYHDQGFYGLAARCASRLAGLWPKGNIYTAPPSIQRLAYPLPFADLLSAEAGARNLDPLLLAALIRQESLFEPAAESYAGARGLGQVMPATGQGIARSLKMDDFVLDDLYRPWVSVRFGAFYLDVQLNRFNKQVLVALAAYNGGPGNTLHWLEAGGDDLDLFVEVIGANQSRIYLQRVYEQYITYEELYRLSKSG